MVAGSLSSVNRDTTRNFRGGDGGACERLCLSYGALWSGKEGLSASTRVGNPPRRGGGLATAGSQRAASSPHVLGGGLIIAAVLAGLAGRVALACAIWMPEGMGAVRPVRPGWPHVPMDRRPYRSHALREFSGSRFRESRPKGHPDWPSRCTRHASPARC